MRRFELSENSLRESQQGIKETPNLVLPFAVPEIRVIEDNSLLLIRQQDGDKGTYQLINMLHNLKHQEYQ